MNQASDGAVAPEILDVSGVSVSLSGRQILDQVSFTVSAGQFTGLIGPNGAGKTTLLRVILGLQRPTEGKVTIQGQPRSHRDQSIGYVPQKVLLDPDISRKHVCDKTVGECMFRVKDANHLILVNDECPGWCNRDSRSHSLRLTCKAPLTEKIARSEALLRPPFCRPH